MQADLNSQILVTVVICTYNPSKAQFTQTLHALSTQSLPVSAWELVLVDNNSDFPLAPEYPLEWHPNAKWVHEPSPGKPKAIMRGILCAQASLIITVDDDSLLASDYLATAIKIFDNNSHLGVFGSGCTKAAYKGRLPAWLSPDISGYLALRQVNQALMFNSLEGFKPWGLGLCVTRSVAMEWLSFCTSLLSEHPYLNGRKATVLDDDLFSLCAINNGLSYGIFPELRLQHLIEPSRLELSYLSELAYDHGYSHAHFAKFSHQDRSNPIRIGSAKAAFILFLTGRPKLAIDEFRHYVYHLRQSKQVKALRVCRAKGWDHAIYDLEKNNSSDKR